MNSILKFGRIPSMVANKFGRQILMGKHYRPEILVGIGIAGVLTGTVLACKATMKVSDVLDQTRDELVYIQDTREMGYESCESNDGTHHGIMYSDKDANRDKMKVYVKTAGDIVILYAPAVIVGGLSIWAILGGHRILRKENAAIAAAYTGLTEVFKRYRGRVVADVGEEKEREYYLGNEKQRIEVKDKDGKVTSKEVTVIDAKQVSQYARWFDEENPNFANHPDLNEFFLKQQMNWLNETLNARGHIFLNEVYDSLGLKRSEAGQHVGWIKSEDLLPGDGWVDFKIYNDVGPRLNTGSTRGIAEPCLIDFNVDGVISTVFTKCDGFQKRSLI